MSDSVWPHRRKPTRLPRPWDSPGKNTGIGCHFLLQCMKVKSEREVAQSCPTLHNPIDRSLPGSSVHGIFQARVLECGAIAFRVRNYLFLFFWPWLLWNSFSHPFFLNHHLPSWPLLSLFGSHCSELGKQHQLTSVQIWINLNPMYTSTTQVASGRPVTMLIHLWGEGVAQCSSS